MTIFIMAGITLLSDWLVQDYLVQASLIQPFEGSLDGFAYHLVIPEKPSRSALALKDWVIENLGGN